MTGKQIMTAALAHCFEERDKDVLTRNLAVPLINLGIAELTNAENMYRASSIEAGNDVTLLTEPVVLEKPEDDVPYDYHITSILLPLWLAWKVFEGLEDEKALQYRQLYEARLQELVPAVFEQMHDRNGFECWGAFVL